MPLLRWLSVLVFISLLAACGGGGSLENDSGSLDGGDGGTSDNPSFVVEVQGFVEGDAKRELVATSVGVPADVLLGRHVRRGAHDRARDC